MSESSSNLRAIGLMSGTSMDGVDVALLDTDGATHVAMGPAAFFAYSDADRTILPQPSRTGARAPAFWRKRKLWSRSATPKRWKPFWRKTI